MTTAKVGDIVYADQSWFLITEKDGKRIKGRLMGGREHYNAKFGAVFAEHRFTSHRVERVFREMGKRKAQAEA